MSHTFSSSLKGAAKLMPVDRFSAVCLMAFTFFYIEDHNVFSNPAVSDFFLGTSKLMKNSGANLWTVAVTCLSMIVLLLLYRKKHFFISQDHGLAICCAITMVTPLFGIAWSSMGMPVSVGYIGFALFAFGHLCFLPAIVKNLALLGSNRAIVQSALMFPIVSFSKYALLKASVFVNMIVVVATPVLTLACLRAARYYHAGDGGITAADLHIPKTLFVTLFLVGLLSGVHVYMASSLGVAVGIRGEILGSAACLLVVLATPFVSTNYNKLIYLLGVPIIILGVMVCASRSGFLVFGDLVYEFGYFLYYCAVWSLYAYLVRYSSFNYYWLPIAGASGTFLGRFVGMSALGGIGAVPEAASLESLAIAVLVFLVMVISVYFYGQDNMVRGWGAISPPGADNAGGLSDRGCTVTARLFGLTAREASILSYLAKGRDAKFIAGELVISEGTVRTHTKHIYRKMNVHSKQELIDIVEQNRRQ